MQTNRYNFYKFCNINIWAKLYFRYQYAKELIAELYCEELLHKPREYYNLLYHEHYYSFRMSRYISYDHDHYVNLAELIEHVYQNKTYSSFSISSFAKKLTPGILKLRFTEISKHIELYVSNNESFVFKYNDITITVSINNNIIDFKVFKLYYCVLQYRESDSTLIINALSNWVNINTINAELLLTLAISYIKYNELPD